jgi:hypothetical protein
MSLKTFTLVLTLSAVLAPGAPPLAADSWQSIPGNGIVWHSPNLMPMIETAGSPPDAGTPGPSRSTNLGGLAHNQYLQAHGTAPPLDFLRPLDPAPASLARIQGPEVIFQNTGKRVSLDSVGLPANASPAAPYLLSGPAADWLLVVHPYYLLQGKETRYLTELYSSEGVRRATFESLPTQLGPDGDQLLVSAERGGCCESLRWSFRFYDLKRAAVVEYSCPEGECGDAVFSRLEPDGSFVVAFELVGMAGQAGTWTETRIHVVSREGKLAGFGRFIHAIREGGVATPLEGLACSTPDAIAARSPYAVRNLDSIIGLPGEGRWAIRFKQETSRETWNLDSTWDGPSPPIVFP